jgi:hypothetical protein
MANSDIDKLISVTKPLIKYLSDNYNPHTTAIVTTTGVKLVQDVMGGKVEEFDNNDSIEIAKYKVSV